MRIGLKLTSLDRIKRCKLAIQRIDVKTKYRASQENYEYANSINWRNHNIEYRKYKILMTKEGSVVYFLW